MKWHRAFLLLWLGSALVLQAAAARIFKVLPHYLDAAGRHTLSPSLYERDAYQAQLRANPARRSALRFDIHWKAPAGKDFTLRLEARGGRASAEPRQITLETTVRRKGWFGKWNALTLEGQAYQDFGELISWRATLWDGGQLMAEQTSFLW